MLERDEATLLLSYPVCRTWYLFRERPIEAGMHLFVFLSAEEVSHVGVFICCQPSLVFP